MRQIKTLQKKRCRLCDSPSFQEVINIGSHSLVNSFLKKEDLRKKELLFPIVLRRCRNCSLVQLTEMVAPEEIYRKVNYLYFSSDAPGLADYYQEYAEDIKKRFLNKGDFVLEMASNDGIMLNFFKQDYQILGVDPATNVVLRALKRGLPSLPDFFTKDLAQKILKEWGTAKVIMANNCIGHIDDLKDVLSGVNLLLGKDGVFVIEVHYWGNMLKQINYSLIYHDHYSYPTLKVWSEQAPRFGLRVFDAFVPPIQDNCNIRIFLCKDDRPLTKRLKDLEKYEEKHKLNDYQTCLQYRQTVLNTAQQLRQLLGDLKKNGKRLAGYGASAKAGTISRLSNLNKDLLDNFVDDSPAKHGLYTPIYHLPIISMAEAEKNLPDYFVILAPNYAQSIINRRQDFLERGGHFIIPDGAKIKII